MILDGTRPNLGPLDPVGRVRPRVRPSPRNNQRSLAISLQDEGGARLHHGENTLAQFDGKLYPYKIASAIRQRTSKLRTTGPDYRR